MNVRKPADYSAMYRELTEILAQNLPQMTEIRAIGKAVSQRPEKGAASAVYRAVRARDGRTVYSGPFVESSGRCAAGDAAHDRGSGAGGNDAPGLRDRVRLRGPDGAFADAGE